eukprot:CAMPEP_0116894074 /NCGR_PEP_ID=MMETSP0467-20121206/3937_1 /TAXON_ID=283647 /ORGANISM="Mesodinium pulex, Strain SPMC105" /LENGTH=121 /DNA_ID=CAMNT_0004564119 /DNA_START=1134 /DNA_END=1499 /DNA_ORIENTATION=-
MEKRLGALNNQIEIENKIIENEQQLLHEIQAKYIEFKEFCKFKHEDMNIKLVVYHKQIKLNQTRLEQVKQIQYKRRQMGYITKDIESKKQNMDLIVKKTDLFKVNTKNYQLILTLKHNLKQ